MAGFFLGYSSQFHLGPLVVVLFRPAVTASAICKMFGLGVTPIGSLNLQSSKCHHFDDIVSCKHGLPPLEIAFFS
jgi:hypothetical protein